MRPLTARRVPSVIAGILAIAASVTALSTVIWSDFADAAEPTQLELADDVVAPRPVKLAKIEHKPTLLDDPMFDFTMENALNRPSRVSKRNSRINFGSFEGY